MYTPSKTQTTSDYTLEALEEFLSCIEFRLGRYEDGKEAFIKLIGSLCQRIEDAKN